MDSNATGAENTDGEKEKEETAAAGPESDTTSAPGAAGHAAGSKVDQERDGNIWSMEAFAQYMQQRGTAGASDPAVAAMEGGAWVRDELPKRMREVMVSVHRASKAKLTRRRGYFDLFGFDFMLDEQLQLHLLEVNTNPALHIDGRVHARMLPALVEHTLEAVLEAQPVTTAAEHKKQKEEETAAVAVETTTTTAAAA